MSNLLETLASMIRVEYLSDLKSIDYECIRKQLAQICVEDYPEHQWRDAVEYLTNNNTKAASAQDAYTLLMYYKA